MKAVVHIPQLFYKMKNGKLILLAAKVVDDILLSGPKDEKKKFIENLKNYFKVGTIVHGPGNLLFYGLNVFQNENYNIQISSDEKLDSIAAYQLSRLRRKEIDHKLNVIELKAFNSVNGSIGAIGMTVSPYASFVASHLQQVSNGAKISDLIKQNNLLKTVKKFGSTSSFTKPNSKGDFEISVTFFADAGRPNTSGQLGFIGGIMIGNLKLGSRFHTVTWSSQLSKRAVK